MAKSKKITFSQQRPSGMFNPRRYKAKRAGEEIATIQETRSGLWFWHGRPNGQLVNTAGDETSLEACKADIIARFTTPTPTE